MSLMIVGADNLGSIRKNVRDLGFEEITHLSGRKKSKFRNFEIPVNTNFILIIYVWRAKIKHALIQKRSEIK